MRKHVLWTACVAVAGSGALWAANWPTVAGNPQRDGWAQGETHLLPETASKITLLYKHVFKGVKASGLNTLTGVIDISQVIGYTGFHEFLWTSAASGTIFQNDADLNYEFKTATTPAAAAKGESGTLQCPGGVTAAPVLFGLSSVSRFGGGAPGGLRSGYLWNVGADGKAYTMRQQDSNNTWIPASQLVPAGANISALTMTANSTLMAATINGCGGVANGLYASTFTYPEIENEPLKPFKKPPSWTAPLQFLTGGAGFAGAGGVATDVKGDVVFGTIPQGKGTVAGEYSDTTVKLDAKTLAVTDYFTPAGVPAYKAGDVGVTPAVFTQDGKDMVIAGDRAGRVYLLDGASLGGANHHTPLFATEPLVAAGAGAGVFGHFATWVDDAKVRWVLAAVHGPLKVPGTGSGDGAMVAFKVTGTTRPKLVPAWSVAMQSPAGPVVIGGLVAALSSGLPTNIAGMTPAQVEKTAKPAKLSILNASTGAEVFNSGSSMTSFSTTPVAAANGHIYVITHDNTLLQFGIPEER